MLSKIIIGGIKAFSKTIEIPISPLTIIVGPNSAGKSSVALAYDALLNVAKSKEIWSPSINAHTTTIDDAEISLPPVVFGAEFEGFGYGVSEAQDIDWNSVLCLSELMKESSLRVVINRGGYSRSAVEFSSLDIFVDGSMLVSRQRSDERQDWKLRGVGERLLVNAEHEMVRWYLKRHSTPAIDQLDSDRYLGADLRIVSLLSSDYIHDLKINHEFQSQDKLDGLLYFLSGLIHQILENIYDLGDLRRVPGRRQGVPDDFYLADVDADYFRGHSDQEKYTAWIGLRSIKERSKAKNEAKRQQSTDIVNNALSIDLFPIQGYRLVPTVDKVVSKRIIEFGGLSNDEQLSVRYEIALQLKDRHGRLLQISKVGSGVAYVLPVLTTLWGGSFSWIEQPELHLHPAAQCGLGDVFIRSYNEGKFSLIETHSEHMILRILRRIRETTSDRISSADLRCSPEAVIFLYFQPTEEGAVEVHQLRVSRSGDFKDKWPGGFFEERAAELFDE